MISFAVGAVSDLPDKEGEFEIPEWEDDGKIVNNLYPLEAPEEVDIEDCGSDLSLEHKKQLQETLFGFSEIYISWANICHRASEMWHQVRQKAY